MKPPKSPEQIAEDVLAETEHIFDLPCAKDIREYLHVRIEQIVKAERDRAKGLVVALNEIECVCGADLMDCRTLNVHKIFCETVLNVCQEALAQYNGTEEGT